jgi:hypothetical protein
MRVFYLGLYVGLVTGGFLGMALFGLLSANKCLVNLRVRVLEKRLRDQRDWVRRLSTALSKMKLAYDRIVRERDELRCGLIELRAGYSLLEVRLEALQPAPGRRQAELVEEV